MPLIAAHDPLAVEAERDSEHARAHALAEAARCTFTATGDPASAEEVAAWLAKHPANPQR
jgi:hypothetical protein